MNWIWVGYREGLKGNACDVGGIWMGEEMTKKKHYVNLSERIISRNPSALTYDVIIYADDAQVIQLREMMDAYEEADGRSFVRAQFPYLQYHDDEENMHLDHAWERIIEMVHHLQQIPAEGTKSP